MSTKKTLPEPQEEKTDLTADAADVQTEKTDTKAEKKTKDKFSEEVRKLREELAAEKDKYLRLLAEYDNFRKRSQKERECVYTDVRADTLLKFLPVYDNLERALKQETADEAYKRGVEMIFTQFLEIMEKLGVSGIEAGAGTKFDPGVHDAVMHIEDENFAEGVVAEEFQKGFRLGDKVIRCSVVKAAN